MRHYLTEAVLFAAWTQIERNIPAALVLQAIAAAVELALQAIAAKEGQHETQ